MFYRCRCGHEFAFALGKYGCANYLAESGPARLIESELEMTYRKGNKAKRRRLKGRRRQP